MPRSPLERYRTNMFGRSSMSTSTGTPLTREAVWGPEGEFHDMERYPKEKSPPPHARGTDKIRRTPRRRKPRTAEQKLQLNT